VSAGPGRASCDFTDNDEWHLIHPTSIHWIITFGEKSGVLSQLAAMEAENNSRD